LNNIFQSKLITNFTTIFLATLGLSVSFNAITADRNILPVANIIDQHSADETEKEGMLKTLDHNFSPEKRANLRKALDDYARSVDQDHEQIEAKRRAMQESVKERFFDADSDFDNTIDRQEATAKLPQIARHFNSVDTNGDGLISLDELEAAQLRMVERQRAAEAAIEMRKMIGAESNRINQKNTTTQVSNSVNKSAM
jgi:Ca2+-binding EF-hand superfamily protein